VNPSGIVVHCSGSLGLDVLPFEHKGIFYPLQSFSENQTTDWANTPIIITSSEDYVSAKLSSLAIKMTKRVTHMTEDEKSILHVAAVFANNFSNHMLTLAESICRENDIDLEILKPLIKTTFERALLVGPAKSQTGPAIRRDQHTLEKHMALLEGHPDLMELYRLLSKSIRKFSVS
jgi:predicted short-subunit dehydrogenase-like oxidoreductase (DUF2520 family)